MLPSEWKWLRDEPAPKMLVEALLHYGVREKEGDADNPEILSWAREIGCNWYTEDSTPWCGLFIAMVAKRTGKLLPPSPLRARDWLVWGQPCQPELGAVLVFGRQGGGHVGLYVGEDDQYFYVLGGNQSDSVCITRIAKARLLGARCSYKNKPANVRKITMSVGGEPSRNEA